MRISPLFVKALLLSVSLCSILTAFAGGDEGAVIKSLIYEQSTVSAATLIDDPYRFSGTIRNSVPNQTGIISLPGASPWPTNPIAIVTPSQLVGAHYVYEVGFSSLFDLNSAFPNGNYTFDVTRSYGTTITAFSAPVKLTGANSIPSSAPVITNTTWTSGTLILQPSAAQIFYTSASGVGFSWGLVGGGGSGGGAGSQAPGTLNLTGLLRFGQSFSVELRFYVVDDHVTIIDPNAPANAYQKESTYSTILQTVVRFNLQTTIAPANFEILSAAYAANGKTWDVSELLESKIRFWEPDSLIWRMDGWELSNGQAGFSNGVLQISYRNDDGEFSGSVPYLANSWDNYLVLPNPLHAVPEPNALILFATGIVAVFLRSMQRKQW
ncbi:MAG TPA: PEP-CTERM sorting domain-containing protein [Chthoniobacterales bacterium]